MNPQVGQVFRRPDECAHCTEGTAGAEGSIWCAKCLKWWRTEELKSQLQVGQVFRRGRITRTVKDAGEHASFITCLEQHQDGYQRIVRPLWWQWRAWSAKSQIVEPEREIA